MKHLLLTTIATVLLVGCGESQSTVNAPDISIHDAVKKRNITAVKQHLADGVDVNAGNVFGTTPLHFAAWVGHKEIVELLIENGANLNAKIVSGPIQGSTPLDLATLFNRSEIADLLRKHGGKIKKEPEAAEPVAETVKPEPPTAEAPDISIHSAAEVGNIEAVKQHLAAGTEVNAKASGWTPLAVAAHRGHKEVAELLITKGADVNAKDNNGGTPLDVAIQLKRTEIADLLRKHGGKTGEELK